MSGRWQPLELPDGSYSDDTRPWTQQDVVGYLPTFAEMSGTRSRLKLVTAPGLNPFNVCGSGPHRGARNVEGKLFVVSGQTLFQVFTDGSVQERGTIPGTSRVSMTHNQVAGGNQLLIGTTSNSYVWDTSDNTLTANGVPLLSVDFLNQLCLGVDSQRRFWRYSGLADATDWNTLDNESAESSPDRIVGGIVSQGEWLVLGERTVEVWLNSPTDATAFQRGPVIEKGCANAATIQRLDNSVIWLGNDNIVYRLQGYTAVPISTKAMAVSLESASQAKAFAFTYEDRGYSIYYLTFQDGKTWGYDVTSQRWHRRHSMGLDRWRLNTLVSWNGGWYGGDYTDGTLHKVVWGHALEADDYLPRSFSSGVMHGDGNRVRVAAVKLLVDTGGEPSVSDVVIGISGDAPDGNQDDVYSYTYTTVGGTAPYVYTVSSGALPTGVTLPDPSVATISGTLDTIQLATFSIKVTDANGLTAIVRDTIAVTAFVALGKFWMVRNNPAVGAQPEMWFSTDTTDWGNAYTRNNPVIVNADTPFWLGDRMWFGNVGGTDQIVADLNPVDGIDSTEGVVIAHTRASSAGGYLFLCRNNGGSTYAVSTDKGATWTEYTAPGATPRASDVTKLGNRWLIHSNLYSAYYSDEAVPQNWTVCSFVTAGPDSWTNELAASPTAVVIPAGGKIQRTTDGASFSVVYGSVIGDSQASTYDTTNGVFLIGSSDSTCSVYRSADDGLTWAKVIVTGGTGTPQRFSQGGGIVLMFQGENIFKTLDGGITWSSVTRPAGHAADMSYYVGYAG